MPKRTADQMKRASIAERAAASYEFAGRMLRGAADLLRRGIEPRQPLREAATRAENARKDAEQVSRVQVVAKPVKTAKVDKHKKKCKCGTPKYHHCPKCGSCPDDHWVDRDLDHGMVGLDGDVMCRKCGTYVRLWDV